jgi:hypothetical protein
LKRGSKMKTFLLSSVAFVSLSTAALAFDPIGPVNTAAVLRPASPSAAALANHRLYVQNLRAAGFKPDDTSPIGPANTSLVLSPNHSKVPNGKHWEGDNAKTRSPSRSDSAGWH